MKIFTTLYDTCLKWAKHKYATAYLAVLTFAESVFFPIPPDVMLAPMVLSQPKKAWYFASITSISSVIGGIVGYFLGAYLYEPVVLPFIEMMSYQSKFETIVNYFSEYGVLVVFVAGFTPIPYKLFTVSAGMLSMAFWPFVFASAIGRGMRFFLVAGILYFGGEKMEHKIREYVDFLGWLVIVLIVGLIGYKQLF
ncbi:DedA family protein [Psychrosphaera sp. B3R10]|uniref:DedA family protein n=1 Tax=Psychrosphaera algicola TaxID=3023714 RepID=A0ABT5FBX6_9GAMM|nr:MULTISPECIES: YqaA family protein [unclassified Psychrosphaera]MBU2881058.1 DedA family protein [Psychrosphaera sp. I2R16]MBU2989982.1 DedA family protein [Psychrosphaera sp. B3R10]MDC2889051.1 DedA family protein [Psychrosphaera sp. G1-22]MDO6719126.1 YqaA family protein [Psychrosphaera sp. 1_MG-2023]